MSRMLAAYGIENKHGSVSLLAGHLGTSQGTVSGWKARGVPLETMVQVANDTGYSSDWIRTGRGNKRWITDSTEWAAEDFAPYNETSKNIATGDEIVLLNCYRELAEINKNALLTLARAITGKQMEGK